MSVVRHRPAVLADAALLAPLLRAAEQAEVRATHRDVEHAILVSIQASAIAVVTYIDDEPAGIWGVSDLSLLGDLAMPWALATDVADKKPKAFYRECKKIIAGLRQHRRNLINYVDGRHEKALRWAERIGFEVGDPVFFGNDRRPFYKISMGGA
jgi:hypothetical protein